MAKEIDLAIAQFIGFAHAKSGYSILSLIGAMGLTEREWTQICKSEKHTVLSKSDIAEINTYFDKQKQK